MSETFSEGVNRIYEKYADEVYDNEKDWEVVNSYLKNLKNDIIRFYASRHDFRSEN